MHPSTLLSEPEIDRLSGFFETIDTAMNIERFDGFLCALVSGPDTVMLSEYWPIALGCDPATTQVFSTDEETREIIGLVLKHWNSIATRLHGGEIYSPVFLEDDAGQASGIEWAKGFFEGVNIRRELWEELFEDEDAGALLVPMLSLALEDDPDPEIRSKLPQLEKREDILATAAIALAGIYDYFKQRRTPLMSSTPVRRSEPKVGRNEPCPCGSGAKYKNCCLRKAH